jgi:Neisseria PilC beta-propeller domain
MMMNHRAQQIAAIAVLVALALPRAASAQSVDDSFLVNTSVSPQVVMFIDNSYRMRQIEWHWAYDPEAPNPAPTCTDFVNTTDYVASGNNETHCGKTRKIYQSANADNRPTLWNGKYLNWYFSAAADPYITEINTAKDNSIGCTQAGGGKKFEELYRRTRNEAARHVLLDLLCQAEPKGVLFGLGTFRSAADAGGLDPNGGYIAEPIDRSSPTHASNMEAALSNMHNDNWAPLSESLFQLYTYLMPRVAANVPFGKNGFTAFPMYTYDKFGNYDTGNAMLTDPVKYPCQKNFIVMVTGGSGSRDDFDRDPASTSQGFDNFKTALIGDYDSGGPQPNDPSAANEETFYLDDIAKFMQDHDLRPDMAGDQKVDLYTVGFGTTSAYDAYLSRAADLGNGLFYHVNDGSGLSRALLAALNDIVEKSRSFTAATVPSSRTTDGGDLYNSFFLPTGSYAFWEGHLRAWKFSAAGEILDRDGHCALDDPDGGSQCNNGPFRKVCQTGESWPTCVNPYWDAGDATKLALVPGDVNPTTTPWPVVGNNARKLFTSKLSSGVPALTDLDQNLSAADMKISNFAIAGEPPPNSSQYTIAGSGALNAEGLADEVVAYARGCYFGTGATSNVSTVIPCSPRSWLIGDIFHSDPIVVRNPLDRSLGSAYDSFRTNYISRDRVIYTGTNGGFLEGFHAGTWNAGTQLYDQGTGVEKFGFMPWMPRTRIKHQPVDDPAARHHYVDGAPQVADAWLYGTWTSATQTASQWRTILVGGLREGGRHYYALDITNPSGTAPPGGGSPIAYPGFQWEFPNEDDYNKSQAGTGCGVTYPCDYRDLGETWGQPVITRVKLNASGNTVDRWVAVVTGGYDVTSDPNPVAVDPTAGQYVASNCATTVNPSTASTNPTTAAVAPSCQGRAIYMLDLKTGKVIAQQKMGATAPNDKMNYSIVSAPAVLDIDADGYADIVYVGDLRGQLWKWVINATGEDRANDGSGLRTQPNWKFQLFFQAPAALSGTQFKNIFQPPAAALINGTLWLTFGTGERAAIGYLGNTSTTNENNRYYVINDPDPLATSATTPAIVTEPPSSGSCASGYTCAIQDVTSSSYNPGSYPRGYYFRGLDGEKFVTTSVIFAGKVIMASYTPSQLKAGDPGFDPCTQRGSGNLYKFNLTTGVGDFTDPVTSATSRFTSIGSGLPTDPKISIGVGGDDNKIVIQKSGTEIEIINTDSASFGRGIIYWRELH